LARGPFVAEPKQAAPAPAVSLPPESTMPKLAASSSPSVPPEPEAPPPERAREEAPRPPDLNDPALYLNRQLSWLAFNERVLAEALLDSWPLLERVKFLAIFFSNLDEFFMIRVAGLHEQLEAAVAENSADGLSPRDQLARIAQVARRLAETAVKLFADELLPALARERIHIRDWKSLPAETRKIACQYYRRAVFPVLTPLAVDPGHPFPFISNLTLSLAVEARDPETKERKFARVKVPESLPRFVHLGNLLASEGSAPAPTDGVHELLPLEQLIAANLEDLFPGMEPLGCFPFRVTRDMDLEIEEEAQDLLSIVDREVRRRRFGACVRLEIDAGIPDRIRRLLKSKLEIDDEDVYESTAPLGLAALMSIIGLPRPDLRDPTFSPRVPAELRDESDLFAAIRKEDILLHHPYDSFTPVLDFLRQAAEDPEVLAIKMTIYRAGANSEAIKALVRAAENHKEVAVSIELKARFDEENNILWARTLEHAGAHVFYGDAALKTHAKMVLVVRRERQGLQRYVHLGTGNYNASTARLYTDLGLLTADRQIGEDVSELFNSLSGFSKKSRYRKLAVAPAGMRETVLAQIDQQAAAASDGRPARIFAKMNSLVDMRVIQALYRASRAGVPIELCVRGICCLRPGLPGVSDNIRVISVLGRFLEHERVFVFGPEGKEAFFLASADWMPRNLDRRVEVMFPIESEKLRAQIRQEVMEPLRVEQGVAYEMKPDGSYQRRPGTPGQPPRSPQTEVLDRTQGRTSGSNGTPAA
jgi:polyphosphate kinase